MSAAISDAAVSYSEGTVYVEDISHIIIPAYVPTV